MIKLFVGEGPYQTPVKSPRFADLALVFKKKPFRAAAFGYFGHMWELYAFWAFVPVILASQRGMSQGQDATISTDAFLVIGLGALACFIGGFLSERFGTKKMAMLFLFLSILRHFNAGKEDLAHSLCFLVQRFKSAR